MAASYPDEARDAVAYRASRSQLARGNGAVGYFGNIRARGQGHSSAPGGRPC